MIDVQGAAALQRRLALLVLAVLLVPVQGAVAQTALAPGDGAQAPAADAEGPTPTAEPTDEPTAVPTPAPAVPPVPLPLPVPTAEPTDEPSAEPTAAPTDDASSEDEDVAAPPSTPVADEPSPVGAAGDDPEEVPAPPGVPEDEAAAAEPSTPAADAGVPADQPADAATAASGPAADPLVPASAPPLADYGRNLVPSFGTATSPIGAGVRPVAAPLTAAPTSSSVPRPQIAEALDKPDVVSLAKEPAPPVAGRALLTSSLAALEAARPTAPAMLLSLAMLVVAAAYGSALRRRSGEEPSAALRPFGASVRPGSGGVGFGRAVRPADLPTGFGRSVRPPDAEFAGRPSAVLAALRHAEPRRR